MIIISIIGVIVGGLNWMSIGLLQYDFIAGVFGTQASIFSRLIYIAIGVCTIYTLFDLIRNRGKILLFNLRNNKQDHYQPIKTQDNQTNSYISNQNDDILN